jgi:hypothetical protein
MAHQCQADTYRPTTEDMFEMLSVDSGAISMVALNPMTKCHI